jgi:hypothetical protein
MLVQSYLPAKPQLFLHGHPPGKWEFGQLFGKLFLIAIEDTIKPSTGQFRADRQFDPFILALRQVGAVRLAVTWLMTRRIKIVSTSEGTHV